jgi:D-3-phosphoglycerate dehydrogenase
VGNIGKAVLRRARAFGMRLFGNDIVEVDKAFLWDVGVEMVTLDQLLSLVDFVSLN